MENTVGPDRRLCWLLVATGIVLLGLGAVAIPWTVGPDVPPVDPGQLFTAEHLARAEDYAGTRRVLAWSALAVSVAVASWLGLTTAGARLAGRVQGSTTRLGRLGGTWWLVAALTTLGVILAGRVATLPLDVLARRNALAYGITEQSWSGWARDQLVSLGVGWAFTAVVVLVILGAMRRAPRRWPAVIAGVGVMLTFATSWVYPVVVEPLFNDFEPLPPGELRSEVLRLARAQGVEVSEVLVVDASRRTTTLNAYVSGIGSTRRVVLYDTLLEGAERRETLTVVAHELAHERHRDVLVGTGLAAAGVVLGGGVLGLVWRSPRLRRWSGLGERRGAAGPEAVALLLLLSTGAGLVAAPVQGAASRAIETRADVDALAATADCAGFEAMQRRLAMRSLADPTPPWLGQAWFGSHPTVLQRVALARASCPDTPRAPDPEGAGRSSR